MSNVFVILCSFVKNKNKKNIHRWTETLTYSPPDLVRFKHEQC